MAIHSFTGNTTDPILVAHNVAWKTPAWTMSVWIRGFNSVNRPGVFSTSLAAGATAVGVCWEQAGFGIWISAMNVRTPIIDISNNLWWHATVTFDATDMRTYGNGALSGNQILTGMGAMVWGTNPLTLVSVDGGALWICLPKIYNRKLSATEVATLAGGGEVTSGLVARWPGNEGTGTTIVDDVGGFNATTAGTVNWSNDIPSQLVTAPTGGAGRSGFSSSLIRGH